MIRTPLLPDLDSQDLTPTIKTALGRMNYEAKVAELVSVTGIPVRYVEESLELLTHQYGSSYRVSEAGEIIYRFPNGFRETRRNVPSLRSRLLRMKHTAGVIAGYLLKRWLLVLLAGYSAVFLTLLFPPVLIIFAILLGSWFRGDILRVYGDRDFYGYRVRAAASCRVDSWKPLRSASPGFKAGESTEKVFPVAAHESLFDYLFGDIHGETLARRKQLSKVLSFIGDRKGIISLDEIMILTGMNREEAEEYVAQLLLSYQGEPTVTGGGTIVYEFPNLVRSDAARVQQAALTLFDQRRPEEAGHLPEGSQKSSARTITTLNLFNLFFGVYYTALSLECLVGKAVAGPIGDGGNAGMSFLFNSVYSFMAASHFVHAVPLILLALGIVPAGISSLFFLLHLRARRRDAASHREHRERCLRQQIYSRILSGPATVDPTRIVIDHEGREISRSYVAGVLDELAAAYDGEIEDVGDEHYVYHFRELERRLHDIDLRRARPPADSPRHENVAYDSQSSTP